MNELIRDATSDLAGFLAVHLPTLAEDWWSTLVVDRLTFQQQRIVEERRFTELAQLDFAALLRIFDQNWYELSQTLSLPREGRTWVRELQAVRNRWAHLSAAPMSAEDLYRDADTLGRVLNMLGTATASVALTEAVKKQAISDIVTSSNAHSASMLVEGSLAAPSSRHPDDTVALQATTTMFKAGDLVALRSNPDTVVPIIGVMAGTGEARHSRIIGSVR